MVVVVVVVVVVGGLHSLLFNEFKKLVCLV
jgi:hypothetical protein